MKIFLGWSGARSQALAQALHDWIPLVLHYAEPWMSEKDIGAGARWEEAISKELEASNFGLMAVTRQNIASHWIHFEAGSLAKSMDIGKVVPLLLDLDFSEISGPLAQFQAKKADKVGLGEVIRSINGSAENGISEDQLTKLFGPLWPQLESQIHAIPGQDENAQPARPQTEILEELVSSVRSISARLGEMEEVFTSGSFAGPREKLRKFNPGLTHDLPRFMGESPDSPINILVIASQFRDLAPWIYEIGAEAYRIANTGNSKLAGPAVRKFLRAVEASKFVLSKSEHREFRFVEEVARDMLRPWIGDREDNIAEVNEEKVDDDDDDLTPF